MKIKVLLLALGCTMGTLGAYAQKGVDNGTQFGSGEDSVRCITNISLFVPYAKAGNFKDAFDFWKIVYDECPAATKDIYLYGVKIMGWKIAQEKDPAKKKALIDDLMSVYDKRVKYFGNDRKYGKDWIVARKVQDYLAQTGDNADYNQAYTWLKEIVDEKGADTEALGLSLFSFSSMKKMLNDPNFKEQYIQDYLKVSGGLDAQLKAAQAANNQKEVNALTAYKSGVDNAFANSGAADCETLQNLYAAKIEENKENLPYLKETISLLRRTGCQEIEAYFLASDYAYRQEPSAEAAVGLGKKAVKIKDYDTAIKYFDEAANLETDATSKADDYYMIALLLFEQNAYSKARQYCQKALEANPNYGNAYLLIGKMYAATSKSVFPNDGVLARAAYNAAIDKFEKAKQVDPSVAEEANTLISSYRAHLPSTEEIFMHPDLEKGKPFTVVVVVMLLLFSASCSKEHKEVVDVEFDPDKTYTMKATDVSSLISDSGITRYRLKAKEWQIYGKAAEPHWYFPEGIYVEKFDTLFQTEASIKADTAYYYDKKGLWELESLQGEHFETSQLFWDQKQEKVYSDKFMRIEQEDKIITGIGFESNQDMTQYKIFNSQGIFPVSDAPADTTRTAQGDSARVDVSQIDSIKSN